MFQPQQQQLSCLINVSVISCQQVGPGQDETLSVSVSLCSWKMQSNTTICSQHKSFHNLTTQQLDGPTKAKGKTTMATKATEVPSNAHHNLTFTVSPVAAPNNEPTLTNCVQPGQSKLPPSLGGHQGRIMRGEEKQSRWQDLPPKGTHKLQHQRPYFPPSCLTGGNGSWDEVHMS